MTPIAAILYALGATLATFGLLDVLRVAYLSRRGRLRDGFVVHVGGGAFIYPAIICSIAAPIAWAFGV